jgi:2,4-dienoyl-CoA reductase-like NADH-dependent reductase (Old Yellow Enzyme family)
VVHSIGSEYPDLHISVRLNVTDGIRDPYGFGVAEDGSIDVDLTEPKALINKLLQSGCNLLNATAGLHYHSPHIGRPFDRGISGSHESPEHPLEGVSRLIGLARDLSLSFPETPTVGTGFSWLRQFWPNVGAATVDRNMASFVGLGRGSFAYPGAPRDLMELGKLDPKKCCIACSRCTELIRNLQPSGCVIRDREIYREVYRRINN